MDVDMRKQIFFPLALLYAVAGGLFFYAASAPYDWWALGIIGLALLWTLSTRNNARRAFGFGFVWAFTYFFLLFDWIAIASGMLLTRIALAVIQALFVATVALFWHYLWKVFIRRFQPTQISNILLLVVGAIFPWLAMEQLRSQYPLGGMPWGITAFSYVNLPIARLATIGSTQLVGGLVLSIAIFLALSLYFLLKLKLFPSFVTAFLALFIFCAPFIVSTHNVDDQNIKVAIVQGNVPQGTVTGSRSLQVTQNHAEATQKILKDKPDLILLPESASDRDMRVDAEAKNLIYKVSRQSGGVPLLLGTQAYFANTRTNDYVVYTANGITDTYSKQHPVPFGEYVPWRKKLERFFPEVKQIYIDMTPGKKPAQVSVPLKNKTIKVGVPICFEVAYTNIVAEGMKDAKLLVVPTNNASFGRSNEPFQQFAMTRFRALEHGKSAIQVSTSGTSGMVYPNGVVSYKSKLFTENVQVVKVPLLTGTTFAARTYILREILVYIGAGFIVVFVCFQLIKYKQSMRKYKKGSNARNKKKHKK